MPVSGLPAAVEFLLKGLLSDGELSSWDSHGSETEVTVTLKFSSQPTKDSGDSKPCSPSSEGQSHDKQGGKKPDGLSRQKQNQKQRQQQQQIQGSGDTSHTAGKGAQTVGELQQQSQQQPMGHHFTLVYTKRNKQASKQGQNPSREQGKQGGKKEPRSNSSNSNGGNGVGEGEWPVSAGKGGKGGKQEQQGGKQSNKQQKQNKKNKQQRQQQREQREHSGTKGREVDEDGGPGGEASPLDWSEQVEGMSRSGSGTGPNGDTSPDLVATASAVGLDEEEGRHSPSSQHINESQLLDDKESHTTDTSISIPSEMVFERSDPNHAPTNAYSSLKALNN